jgi:energy-coupling factor transporter ATP-binding protein EcfA2
LNILNDNELLTRPGAGKSTLIKILIDKEKGGKVRSDGLSFSSPITSLANNNLPTSGDVHLYSDPMTYGDQCPVMYADCEGLEGGDAIPGGAMFKQKDGVAMPTALHTNQSHDPQFRKKLRKKVGNPQRDIAWAVDPETKRREFAVTHLYPRLLYTFSDTVVYVLKNSKYVSSPYLLQHVLSTDSLNLELSSQQFSKSC